MRASRLLSTLILLQTRGRVTAEALAQQFGVSVRTVYRDVDELSAAGVPVYAERGRNGGFSLLDGYRTDLTGFSDAEASALLLFGLGEAVSDLGIAVDLAAVRLKLIASLGSGSGATAERVATRFHLDPVAWYGRSDPARALPSLAEAVWNEKRIRIRYESWKEHVERELDPLGLVLKGGIWYLVASVAKEPRTYRVSNIRSLDVIAGSVRRSATFNLASYWSAWTKDFEARLHRERAIVWLSPTGMSRLREVSHVAAEAAARNQRPTSRAGWVETEIPIESVEDASRQLLRLGADLEVIEPRGLRAAIALEARQILERHGGSRKGRARAHKSTTSSQSRRNCLKSDRPG